MLKIEKAFYQIFIFLGITIFLWNSARIVTFPFGVDYGEAPLMDQVRRIQNGDSLYKENINEPPYIFLIYPPLYPLVVAALNLFLKIPIFQTGRLVSLFFAFISATIIGLICFKLTKKILLSALSIILFLGHPYVMIWSSLARVDSMALAFSLMGVWILFQFWDSKWSIGMACLFFLVSAYTRQTFIFAGPLAGCAWLWQHERKRALAFISLYGITGLVIFLLVNILTKGAFYQDIVITNINQFYVSRIWQSFTSFFEIWPLISTVVLIFIILIIIYRFSNRQANQLRFAQEPLLLYSLFVYSVVAFLVTLAVGKVGSSVNYFLELITAGVICFMVVIDYFMKQKGNLKYIFGGLAFLQFVWVLARDYQIGNFVIGTRIQNIAIYDKLFHQVKLANQNGIVLSDDFQDLIVLSGQFIYYEPYLYGLIYDANKWDPSELTNEVTEKIFPLILVGNKDIVNDCCWPPPIARAILGHYGIDDATGVLIFTPIKNH
jgi:hypothetical protein